MNSTKHKFLWKSLLSVHSHWWLSKRKLITHWLSQNNNHSNMSTPLIKQNSIEGWWETSGLFCGEVNLKFWMCSTLIMAILCVFICSVSWSFFVHSHENPLLVYIYNIHFIGHKHFFHRNNNNNSQWQNKFHHPNTRFDVW